MANILFGGPQTDKEHNPKHDELIHYLYPQNRVRYVTDAEPFLWEIGMMRMCNKLKDVYPKFAEKIIDGDKLRPYELVIYDFDLLFNEVPLEKRVEVFDSTTGLYLSVTEKPTIIIAPEHIKFQLKPKVLDKGFELITHPYSVGEVLDKINSLL